MPTNVTLTMPDRAALRALYDTAVGEINTLRQNDLLTRGFYAKTGDAVFDVCYSALSDAITNTRRMHTVSAPAGGGKTSYSYAFVAAITRYAESHLDAPYGSAFVVDQIEKADQVYRDLNELLPGKVAIWTTDHDTHCKEPEKVMPAAKFTREELKNFPVIVVTHKFYLGTRGHHARTILRNGVPGVRALTVVDERPDEAPTLEIELSEAQAVREALAELHPQTKEHMDRLLRFMEEQNYAGGNKLYRPGIELDYNKLTEELGWFKTKEAKLIAKNVNISGIDRLFAFAKALMVGRACVATNGVLPYFFGYQEQRIVDLTAGSILLDATADIDGISSIVPWRVPTETPKATYENLEITYVPQHTKSRLNRYLKTASNQRAYVNWMEEIVKQLMNPGEKGLVICKKVLFEAERIPKWPEGDLRFKDPKIYTEDYGWDVEGRHLCAIHWGTGVGSNVWKDTQVVFLFDEFIIPRRVAVATTQGYRGHRTHQGDLGSMTTLHSKARGVDSIAEGHALRWTKQLALRGRARFYDENGVCGKQRVVVASDLKRFRANAHRLFPGAKIKIVGDIDTNLTTKILDILDNTPEQVLTTKALSKLIQKDWRKVSSNVRTPEFLSNLAALGWRYVAPKGKPGRGKLGARFERVAAEYPQATLSNTCDEHRPTVGEAVVWPVSPAGGLRLDLGDGLR